MHIHVVMDHQGDSRHEFDPADDAAIAAAEAQFYELTAKGFRAVALGTGGDPGRLLRHFDLEVEQILFIPQLQGG